jgi:hypothetical protein
VVVTLGEICCIGGSSATFFCPLLSLCYTWHGPPFADSIFNAKVRPFFCFLFLFAKFDVGLD